MAALIDSSVLIAVARPRENRHREAVDAVQANEEGGLYTPVTILAETMSFLGARVGVEQQRRFWDGFIDSGIELVQADVELLQVAREIDRRYADVRYGFADCTLLAAAELLQCEKLLSFDRHLAAYRPDFTDSLRLLP